MKKIFKYLLIILAIIMQATLFRYIAILDVKPDIVIILVISFALLNGINEGIILSLFGGLLEDIMFNNAIGIVTLSLLLVGYLSGLLGKNVFKENTFVNFVFVFLGTIVYNLIMIFSMVLMKYDLNVIGILINKSIIQAVYNSIITIFAYKYIIKLNNYMNESKKFFFKV